MTYEPGLDIIVVNYRTHWDLSDFCESLAYCRTDSPWHLWIINVEPGEMDRQAANRWLGFKGWAPGRTSVANLCDNVGYGRAVNYAAKQGGHDTIAFFNADVELAEGALDRCREALWGGRSTWGLLGPRQVDDGKITCGGIGGTRERPAHRTWMSPDVADRFTDIRDNCPFVNGSAVFVKRDTWDELASCPVNRQVTAAPPFDGPMLPTQLYYEETWLGYHAIEHGWRNVYYGPVTITHKWHRAIKATHGEGWAMEQMKESRKLFRRACDAHGIGHD